MGPLEIIGQIMNVLRCGLYQVLLHTTTPIPASATKILVIRLLYFRLLLELFSLGSLVGVGMLPTVTPTLLSARVSLFLDSLLCASVFGLSTVRLASLNLKLPHAWRRMVGTEDTFAQSRSKKEERI